MASTILAEYAAYKKERAVQSSSQNDEVLAASTRFNSVNKMFEQAKVYLVNICYILCVF